MQRDLDRPQGCAITSHMKFKKTKYQILHPGQGNLSQYMYRLGDELLGSCPVEMDLWLLIDSKLSIEVGCDFLPNMFPFWVLLFRTWPLIMVANLSVSIKTKK